MRLALLLAVVAVLGCQPTPPPAKNQATATWAGGQLVVKGEKFGPCVSVPCRVGVAIAAAAPDAGVPLELSFVVLDGLPSGKLIWERSETRTFSSRVSFPLAREKLGEVDLTTHEVRVPGELIIAMTDHDPIKVTIDPPLRVHPELVLSAGPVAFAAEVDDPARTAWFISSGHAELPSRAVGPGKLLRDIDWLVHEERTESGKQICKGYREQRSGQKAEVIAFAYDSKLVVRDRRTGTVVKEEVFKSGPPTCPNLSFGFAGARTEVPAEKLKKWVDALVK